MGGNSNGIMVVRSTIKVAVLIFIMVGPSVNIKVLVNGTPIVDLYTSVKSWKFIEPREAMKK